MLSTSIGSLTKGYVNTVTEITDVKKYKTSTIEKIKEFRKGLLSDNSEIGLFQELINSGLAWTLGDDISETARVFIKSGKCRLPSPKKVSV